MTLDTGMSKNGTALINECNAKCEECNWSIHNFKPEEVGSQLEQDISSILVNNANNRDHMCGLLKFSTKDIVEYILNNYVERNKDADN